MAVQLLTETTGSAPEGEREKGREGGRERGREDGRERGGEGEREGGRERKGREGEIKIVNALFVTILL